VRIGDVGCTPTRGGSEADTPRNAGRRHSARYSALALLVPLVFASAVGGAGTHNASGTAPTVHGNAPRFVPPSPRSPRFPSVPDLSGRCRRHGASAGDFRRRPRRIVAPPSAMIVNAPGALAFR